MSSMYVHPGAAPVRKMWIFVHLHCDHSSLLMRFQATAPSQGGRTLTTLVFPHSSFTSKMDRDDCDTIELCQHGLSLHHRGPLSLSGRFSVRLTTHQPPCISKNPPNSACFYLFLRGKEKMLAAFYTVGSRHFSHHCWRQSLGVRNAPERKLTKKFKMTGLKEGDVSVCFNFQHFHSCGNLNYFNHLQVDRSTTFTCFFSSSDFSTAGSAAFSGPIAC